MKRTIAVVIVVVAELVLSRGVNAAVACSGVLTEAQQRGFENMFSPAYSPRLVHVGGAVTTANMAKRVATHDLAKRRTRGPVVVVQEALTEKRAALLKQWLNANASASVPGWISTVLGIVVPEAWVGLSADVFLQLLNSAGETGRLTLANIAGTVSQGGIVGVTEQIADNANGEPKFLWTYVYQATLNSKLVLTPLTICSADVITDEVN